MTTYRHAARARIPQKTKPVSGFALRILQRLDAGAPLRPACDGGFRLGALAVPATVADSLRKSDLIEPAEAGAYRLSPAGASMLRRLAARAAGNVADAQEAYRGQHQATARRPRRIGGTVRQVTVNVAESPLGWLASRKGRDGKPLITPEQYEAGERLRADFERASLGPRLTLRLDGLPMGVGGTGGLDPSSAQIAAKRRVDAAIAAVGPGLADILLRVCCFLEGMEQAESGLGWPTRSGKLVLGLALDRLGAYYRSGKKSCQNKA